MRTEIHIYSHYFAVRHPDQAILAVIYGVAQDYTKFGQVYDPKTRKKVWRPEKTFALYMDKGNEFRFHIGQWPHFEEQFEKGHINRKDYTIVKHAPGKADPEVLTVREGWVLRPDQMKAKTFVLDTPADQRYPLLSMPTGTGKFFPLETPIKVPGGWKLMADVHAGDYVTSWDGTPSRVIGEYPQPENAIYRITFGDGRSVECCIDHLWYVHASDQHYKSRVVDTRRIIHMLSMNTYKDRLFIDLPSPEDGPDLDFTINPYVLGVLLGDGSISQNSIGITKLDDQLFDNVQKRLPYKLEIKRIKCPKTRSIVKKKGIEGENPLRIALKEHDLQGKRSWEKYIPEIYLHGSRQQRLDLVRGLLDTDGTVGRDGGTISFTSTSKQLAEGFQYLIRSLGGLAKMTSRFTFYTYKDEKKQGRQAYTIFVRYKKPSELFLLSRKGVLTKDDGQYTHRLKLKIVSVEYTRHAVGKCIAIDHPDKLYVVNDFIVTHNTVTGLVTSSEIGNRLAVVMLSRFIDKWVEDIKKTYDVTENEVCVIRGGDSLMDASHWVSSGAHLTTPLPKVFLISIETLMVWIRKYIEDPESPELEAYGCKLDDFIESLGIGTVMFDEVHMSLHQVYQVFCFLNVEWALCLSATLMSKDPIIQRVQKMMFPRYARFEEILMEQYINCYACAYQIHGLEKTPIQTTEYGSNMYSHVAFERSMLKHKRLGDQYIRMLVNMVKDSYHARYQEGDKCIVYVAQQITAQRVRDAIKQALPKYDTRTYLMHDPYENAMDPDIRVTTIISAGTALDIPNLRVAIMSISVDSPVSNLQALGRLRKLKDRDVHFYYLYCGGIKKQLEFHRSKVELLQPRVKDIATVLLPPLMA